jgi:hypothetical protein
MGAYASARMRASSSRIADDTPDRQPNVTIVGRGGLPLGLGLCQRSQLRLAEELHWHFRVPMDRAPPPGALVEI